MQFFCTCVTVNDCQLESYYYAALLPRRGPHIASHSVCLSVRLSVRPSRYRCHWLRLFGPASVTSRHLANYNDTHVLFGTHWGPNIVRPSRPHKFLFNIAVDCWSTFTTVFMCSFNEHVLVVCIRTKTNSSNYTRKFQKATARTRRNIFKLVCDTVYVCTQVMQSRDCRGPLGWPNVLLCSMLSLFMHG